MHQRSREGWTLGWIGLLSVVLPACPGDGSEPRGRASADRCEAMAEHYEKLCGEGFGSVEAAALLYDCRVIGYPDSAVRCVLDVERCDGERLGACDIHDRSWGCGQDDDCPPELMCSYGEEDERECRACADDGHCEAEQLCLDGWCVRDSATNRDLQTALE